MKNILMMLALIGVLVFTGGINSSCADAPKSKDTPLEKPSKDDGASLTGKVVETMDTGGYTYIKIEQDGKSIWAAIPLTKITVGQDISVQPGFVMDNFKSKTLDRTFDSIVFSSGIAGGAEKKAPAPPTGVMPSDETHSGIAGGAENKAPAPPTGVMPSDETHSGIAGGAEKKAPAPPTGVMPSDETHAVKVPDKQTKKIIVEKAEGPNAYTVAELHAKRVELDTKSIVLKGEVVKVGKAIMGKNWIHIQDGSGSASDKTNDIVVTSQDVPSVGDIVTAKGTLYKDKDFGMGYFFTVIIEEGSIK